MWAAARQLLPAVCSLHMCVRTQPRIIAARQAPLPLPALDGEPLPRACLTHTHPTQTTATWVDTPDQCGGGIWMSAAPPTIDGDDIFLTAGNGAAAPSQGEYSSFVARLRLDETNATFSVQDYFIPYNHNYLSLMDYDFGSTGVLLYRTENGGCRRCMRGNCSTSHHITSHRQKRI